ncbi:MAG: hypothetical protein ACXVCE_13795, partial [Bacteriovorax sp.]
MKKMYTKEIVTKAQGGEYLIGLVPGDAFVSFHKDNGECLGVYLKKTDVKKQVLEEILAKIKESHSMTDLLLMEVKIISASFSLSLIHEFFQDKKFRNIKKVEKEGSIEVMFLPELNKVRVSKESKAPAADNRLPISKFKV